MTNDRHDASIGPEDAALKVRTDGRTIHVPVDGKVVDRLVQEEIWAQTLWPDGVPQLSDILALFEGLDPTDQAGLWDVMKGAAGRFLAR